MSFREHNLVQNSQPYPLPARCFRLVLSYLSKILRYSTTSRELALIIIIEEINKIWQYYRAVDLRAKTDLESNEFLS